MSWPVTDSSKVWNVYWKWHYGLIPDSAQRRSALLAAMRRLPSSPRRSKATEYLSDSSFKPHRMNYNGDVDHG